MRRLRKGDRCELSDCDNMAEGIIYAGNSDHKKVLKCCDYHLDLISDQNKSEHKTDGPLN